jgi:hypothetical protein
MITAPPNAMPVIHLLALIALNAVLFTPVMGRGFLFDDFGHIFVAAHESLVFGLTHASGGWFYAPVAYLSFKLDWLLWGMRPFPWAATNLVIHTANILLLYLLVLRLWRSQMGAWWAAFGFAFLCRANACAVMNIASRAHPLVGLFWLLAIHASYSFARTQSLTAALAVVACATLAIFAKESGLTVAAAIGLTFAYAKFRNASNMTPRLAASLFGVLTIVLLVYFFLRGRASAAPVSFSGPPCCSYVLSFSLAGYNILFYAWWTFGLMSLLAIALIVSLRLRGIRLHWDSITRYDVLFTLMLFGVAIAPFVLMDWRSETYGYLPGISAGLLLGIVTSSLYRVPFPSTSQRPLLSFLPILCVIGFYATLMVMHNNKWLRLAETNAIVLKDILAQQPTVRPNTFIALTYGKPDLANRFPDSFGDYSFPYAMRVLYSNPTLNGRILRTGEPSGNNKSPEIRFAYIGGASPRVIKDSTPARNRE